MRLLQRLTCLLAFAVLTACAAPDPLEEDLPDMGDFRLAFNIVVADNMQQVPPSRQASAEEWIEVLTAEIDRRFGAYEGDRLYHIAVSVDAYALAPPGVPLILSPKSILVISANVWDDELQQKLHEEPEQISIFEGASSDTFIIGSGIARDRHEQMQVLARNAARSIQVWMLQNPEWFSIDPDAAEAAASEIEATIETATLDLEAEAAAAADAEATVTDPETELLLPQGQSDALPAN